MGNNNFAKIDEAKALLQSAGIGDWEDVKEILAGRKGASEFAAMMKEGNLMTISFTPDFSATGKIRFPVHKSGSRAKLRTLADMMEDGINRNQTSVIRRIREYGREMRKAYVEKALEYRFCKMNVGIIGDPMHHGYMSSLRYSVLFYLLLNKGYDPLWTIRQPDEKKRIETEMGNAILEEMSRYARRGGVLNIKRKMKGVGRRVVSTVRDYIYGGEKPTLADNTLKSRRWRAEAEGGEGLYKGSGGIEEPLFETGNLCNAIDFTITVNDALFEYIERKDNETKAAERRLKNTIQKAYAAKERMRTAKRTHTMTVRSAAGEVGRGREVASAIEQARSTKGALGISHTKIEGKTSYRTRYIEAKAAKKAVPKAAKVSAAKKATHTTSFRSVQQQIDEAIRKSKTDLFKFKEEFNKAYKSIPSHLGVTSEQFSKDWRRYIKDDFEREDLESLFETAKTAVAFLRSHGFIIKGARIVGRLKK